MKAATNPHEEDEVLDSAASRLAEKNFPWKEGAFTQIEWVKAAAAATVWMNIFTWKAAGIYDESDFFIP